jgi:hypothetical protein
MALGRPKTALVLSPQHRGQLESLASSRSLPAGLVTRARIVLMSTAGIDNQEIARQLRTTKATVGKWRRFGVAASSGSAHISKKPSGFFPTPF